MPTSEQNRPITASPASDDRVTPLTSGIVDAGTWLWEPLLASLRLESDSALGLGLAVQTIQVGGDSDLSGATRLHGHRHGRQVEIRLGVSEVSWRNYSVMCTWIRTPMTKWSAGGGQDGSWGWDPLTPGVAARALAALRPVKAVWRGTSVRAGQQGLVVARAVKAKHPQGYLDDLWLAERLVDLLALPSLPPVDLARTKMPYRMGTRRGRVG